MPPRARVDRTHYNIYLALCTPESPTHPTHWILLLGHPNSRRCTWYHSVNETGIPSDYKLAIQPNKRFYSWGFEEKFLLGTIPVQMGGVVEREAGKVPVQNCQFWVCYVILRLERRGCLEGGCYEKWRGMVTEEWGDKGPGKEEEEEEEELGC